MCKNKYCVKKQKETEFFLRLQYFFSLNRLHIPICLYATLTAKAFATGARCHNRTNESTFGTNQICHPLATTLLASKKKNVSFVVVNAMYTDKAFKNGRSEKRTKPVLSRRCSPISANPCYSPPSSRPTQPAQTAAATLQWWKRSIFGCVKKRSYTILPPIVFCSRPPASTISSAPRHTLPSCRHFHQFYMKDVLSDRIDTTELFGVKVLLCYFLDIW